MTNFTTAQPQDLYDNTVGATIVRRQRGAERAGFQDAAGDVSQLYPRRGTPITLLWLAKSAYPALFEDIDITQQTVDYYKTVFGVTLTRHRRRRLYARWPDARSVLKQNTS